MLYNKVDFFLNALHFIECIKLFIYLSFVGFFF